MCRSKKDNRDKEVRKKEKISKKARKAPMATSKNLRKSISCVSRAKKDPQKGEDGKKKKHQRKALSSSSEEGLLSSH